MDVHHYVLTLQFAAVQHRVVDGRLQKRRQVDLHHHDLKDKKKKESLESVHFTTLVCPYIELDWVRQSLHLELVRGKLSNRYEKTLELKPDTPYVTQSLDSFDIKSCVSIFNINRCVREYKMENRPKYDVHVVPLN